MSEPVNIDKVFQLVQEVCIRAKQQPEFRDEADALEARLYVANDRLVSLVARSRINDSDPSEPIQFTDDGSLEEYRAVYVAAIKLAERALKALDE